MAEKFPTPQERAMAWLLEAQEIRRHEQAGDRSKTPLGFARAVYETNHKEENR